MIKFHSGKSALIFWFNGIEASQEFGMPSLPLTLEEAFMAEESYKNWDYPDWFYTWIELDKVVRKTDKKDQRLIVAYFKAGYHLGKSRRFYQWPEAKKWTGVCRRFLSKLPQELRR